MSVLDYVASRLCARELSKLEAAARAPEKAQAAVLAECSPLAFDTFRSQVPIQTYAQYKPWLERVYQGEALTREPPYFFGMSAGSTGAFKHIPYTPGLKRQFDRAVRAYQGAFERALPGLKGKRFQLLVGSAEGGTSPAGVAQGFSSGYVYKTLPAFLRRRFVVPYELFTIDDADARYRAIAKCLLDAPDLAALSALSPMNLVQLSRAAEALSGKRAREAWPRLQAIACWLGGSMSYYMPTLREHFGPLPHIETISSATEAMFAVPLGLQEGSLLALNSHVFELIRESDGAVLLPHEAEVGARYRLVVSTAGGLLRYDMEDIVLVTGKLGRAPLVAFQCKAGRRVSIANERLGEDDVARALLVAQERTGVRCERIRLVPSRKRMRYVAWMEGDVAGDMAAFATALDAALCQESKGYGFEREDKLLEALAVQTVAPGALAKAGPVGQQKPELLCTDFDASPP